MNARSSRSRRAAAIVTSTALLASGAALSTSPALAVPPAEDCATELPVDQVTRGLAVDGLTVTAGTEPESFSGEVLGVLSDGIAPGVDMIMAELTSAEIDRVGIWQGMSGSPVYDADGLLLGAVAYGLSFGPSPVAGITPYEHMDDYLPAAARVPLGGAMARTVAAETEVTARQASDGLSRLRVPLTINGIDGARLQDLRAERPYITRQGRAGSLVGSASASAAPVPADVRDGGNMGAAISYGTITSGGVGTVTERCGDEAVGFGHPMMFSGATSMGLMPAEALYIQADSLGAGFKVANLGRPVGTITQDRLTGITGTVGETPDEVDVASTVTYGARARDGLSHSLSPDWNADVTAMQLLSLHDVAIDAIQPGSESSGVAISGTAHGLPFQIDTADRYVSRFDIAFESLWDTADLVWLLSGMPGVRLDSVTTDGVVTDNTDTWRVAGVQQRRGGRWVGVTRRSPAVVRAGWVLRLRSRLTGPAGTRWVRQHVPVPAGAREGSALVVAGGSSTFNEDLYAADTFAELEDAVTSDVRNDEVQASVSFWSRRGEVSTEVVSDPQDLVVVGRKRASVVVRR